MQKLFRPIVIIRVLCGNISAQFANFVYYAENFLHNNLICGTFVPQFIAQCKEDSQLIFQFMVIAVKINERVAVADGGAFDFADVDGVIAA